MTRVELEARRLQAIPLLDDPNVSVIQLAKDLGVSRMAVYRWRKARQNGTPLTRTIAPGRPPRMTPRQEQIARSLAAFGPRILLGVDSDRWTQDRFASVLKERLGLKYNPDHVGRIMRRLGLREKRERRLE